MPCVLVSCCGLPAAGKTTFCRSVANCTASGTTTTTTDTTNNTNTTTSATTDANFNTSHMATTEAIMAPKEAMTTSTSSTKYSTSLTKHYSHEYNRLRDGSGFQGRDGSVFRVRHVCFDEHIDQAHRHRRRHSPSGRQPFLKPRTHHSGEGEAREEARRYIEEGPGDRDENASTQNGAESDTNTTAAGVEADAMQHGWAEDEEDTARWWHAGRRDAIGEIEALLAASRSRVVNSPPSPGPTAEAVASVGDRRSGHDETVTDVVIADDNMHFRSMRHELFCLARKYGCGYAQVYFPTGVEVAVERNRGRAAPVAEAVIRKMAEHIQPPDPERFKWERHTVIEPSRFRQNVGGVWEGDNDADVLGHRWASRSWSGAGLESAGGASAMLSFWRAIAAAAEDPVPALPFSATVLRGQESDRAATKASFLHQLDLNLRESVKRVAGKAAEANLTRENIRTVMGACSVSRRACLRRAKGGHWTQQRNAASGEGMTDHKKKIDRCVEDSSTSSFSINSSCASGEEGGGKVAPFNFSPMQEFCFEFERALSGFCWLGSSVRRELAEAARGRTCTKL